MSTVWCRTLHGGVVELPRERLTFRPTVYAVAVRDGSLLLVRVRSTGRYALPGGGVEVGESLEQALRREVVEETGVRLSGPIRLLAVDERFFYYDPLDVAFYALVFFYAARIETGELSSARTPPDDEACAPAWVPWRTLRPDAFQLCGELILRLAEQVERERSTSNGTWEEVDAI
jgi:ADP-ribose pyrophosphatase YjhB (NUDIX family)